MRPPGFLRGRHGWRRCAAVVATAGSLALAPGSAPGSLGWGGATTPAAEAAGPAPAPQPAAVWRLDEPGGTIAHDTAAARDGIAHGGVTFGAVAQGPGTTSAEFDGRTGYVQVPVDGTTSTVTAASGWVRLARGSQGGLLLDGAPVSLGIRLGHPVARSCTDGGCTVVQAATDVRDGAWHAVTASADGATLTLYVDGVAVARASAPGAPQAWHGGAVIGAGLHGDIDGVTLFAAPLPAPAVTSAFRAGACPQAVGAPAPPTTARRSLPALPLHTSGRFVVDAHGHRVKLAGVNWYGAEELDRVPAGLQCQSVDAVAARLVSDGFDVVRLPWATDTWTGAAPRVPPVAVAANPQLRGLDARRAFDAVVAALARHGLMVILDNHVTRADWCCNGTDGNALWWEGYDPHHPPAWARMSTRARTAVFSAGQRRWLRAWSTVAGRYGSGGAHATAAVIGADLRNEPRVDWTLGIHPAWTARTVPAWQDWPGAAEHGGNVVLRANPRLLVAVEGLNYATDLRGAATRPIRLARSHRLVYSAHDYAFFHGGEKTASALRTRLGQRWGYLLGAGHRWTTPVWVGEFGACHPDGPPCGDASWFATFTRYLRDGDIDFTYWSANGTGARGSEEPVSCAATPRFPGCPEGYGISDVTWARDASPALMVTLRALTSVLQKP